MPDDLPRSQRVGSTPLRRLRLIDDDHRQSVGEIAPLPASAQEKTEAAESQKEVRERNGDEHWYYV